MSHSSGIPVSKALAEVFAKNLTDSSRTKRFLKVKIENDQLIHVDDFNTTGSFAEDFDQIRTKLDKGPSYILVRKDEKISTGDVFLLILFVPETALVKEKMLYASTRDNLKKELGYSYFNEDYFCSAPEELTWKEYSAHKSRESEATKTTLLTSSEKAKLEEARMEKDTTTSEYVHGVAFPLSDAAKAALADYAQGTYNWVALRVDTKGETIEFVDKKNVDNASISKNVSSTDPLFIFFRFDHEDSGENKVCHVFVFSCPENAPVKTKMLFSSSKASVLGVGASYKIEVNKKMEIREPEDISEEGLLQDLYPRQEQKLGGVARPSAPGRGGRRLVKKT